jgi:hypothetical protein
MSNVIFWVPDKKDFVVWYDQGGDTGISYNTLQLSGDVSYVQDTFTQMNPFVIGNGLYLNPSQYIIDPKIFLT